MFTEHYIQECIFIYQNLILYTLYQSVALQYKTLYTCIAPQNKNINIKSESD